MFPRNRLLLLLRLSCCCSGLKCCAFVPLAESYVPRTAHFGFGFALLFTAMRRVCGMAGGKVRQCSCTFHTPHSPSRSLHSTLRPFEPAVGYCGSGGNSKSKSVHNYGLHIWTRCLARLGLCLPASVCIYVWLCVSVCVCGMHAPRAPHKYLTSCPFASAPVRIRIRIRVLPLSAQRRHRAQSPPGCIWH